MWHLIFTLLKDVLNSNLINRRIRSILRKNPSHLGHGSNHVWYLASGLVPIGGVGGPTSMSSRTCNHSESNFSTFFGLWYFWSSKAKASNEREIFQLTVILGVIIQVMDTWKKKKIQPPALWYLIYQIMFPAH